jgi:hypothetical protein
MDKLIKKCYKNDCVYIFYAQMLNNYIINNMNNIDNDILSKLLNTFHDEDVDLATRTFTAICISIYFILNVFGLVFMMLLHVY